jgi:hypothetical protein
MASASAIKRFLHSRYIIDAALKSSSEKGFNQLAGQEW